MSLNMVTKGRIFGPESKASQGYLVKLGLFVITKAKWVFAHEPVVRVFSRSRAVRVYDREEVN